MSSTLITQPVGQSSAAAQLAPAKDDATVSLAVRDAHGRPIRDPSTSTGLKPGSGQMTRETPEYLAMQKAMAAVSKLRRGAGPWAGMIQLGAEHKQASKKSK